MATHDIDFVLTRAVTEIIVRDELEKMMHSGRKLRCKEGLDPSAPDIHLGHMVGLRKLRQFQDLGHQVVLIVGDWTAQIGDPTGQSATRPMLTMAQVEDNAKTYVEQFFRILDKDRTEVRWQSEWFGKFDLGDVIRLAAKFTVAQFLQRDDFNARYTSGRPIALSELIYPLLQAYDSVAIQADIEFGGQDQKFNFLVGRQLQEMLGQRPQQCFMTPPLVGTDGVHKMSKSLGNYIGVTEPPNDIFGKAMSIGDDLIMDYFELLTDVPDKELKEMRQALAGQTVNPMELKKRLAKELIIQLYDDKAAGDAAEHFARVFQRREAPTDIAEVSFGSSGGLRMQIEGGKTVYRGSLPELMDSAGIVKSRSEARRLVKQGSVEVDDQTVTETEVEVHDGTVIKVGKHRFFRVRIPTAAP